MGNKSWLMFYGLDKAVTEKDDPSLWEAALRKHWPAPDDPSILVDSLRFGTGRRLGKGEKVTNETDELTASQRALVDVEDWHFSRIDEGQLAAESYHGVTPAPPVILPGMSIMDSMMMQPGQAIPPQIGTVVFQFLSISRPSAGVNEAVVYYGSKAPGVGDGAAYIWKKTKDGQWEQTDQCLSRWLT